MVDAGAPREERDPVVRDLPFRRVVRRGRCANPWSAVRTTVTWSRRSAWAEIARSRVPSCSSVRRTASTYCADMPPCSWPVRSGSETCRNVNVGASSMQVGAGQGDQPLLVLPDREAVDAARPGPLEEAELRLGRERALSSRRRRARRRRSTSTPCPAASCTVEPARSSSQVTPWPPFAASIRRPVIMLVWLGRVTVCSNSVRASSVPAPS